MVVFGCLTDTLTDTLDGLETDTEGSPARDNLGG